MSSGIWAVLFHEGNNVISFPGKRIVGAFFICLSTFQKKMYQNFFKILYMMCTESKFFFLLLLFYLITSHVQHFYEYVFPYDMINEDFEYVKPLHLISRCWSRARMWELNALCVQCHIPVRGVSNLQSCCLFCTYCKGVVCFFSTTSLECLGYVL